MTEAGGGSVVPSTSYANGVSSRGQSANLGDILERVLDRGLVIAGDIKVNLLDIELLTVKLRLLVVSVETARELGIDWWEHDPWLTGGSDDDLRRENRELRERVRALESGDGDRPAIEAESSPTESHVRRARETEARSEDG